MTKLKAYWQNFITSVSLVLNNFIKNLLTATLMELSGSKSTHAFTSHTMADPFDEVPKNCWHGADYILIHAQGLHHVFEYNVLVFHPNTKTLWAVSTDFTDWQTQLWQAIERTGAEELADNEEFLIELPVLTANTCCIRSSAPPPSVNSTTVYVNETTITSLLNEQLWSMTTTLLLRMLYKDWHLFHRIYKNNVKDTNSS